MHNRRRHAPQTPILTKLCLFAGLLATPFTHAIPQDLSLPPSAEISQDTGQVTITGPPTTSNTSQQADIPITATIFTSVPGPSACRGSILLDLEISFSKTEQCIDMPRPVSCGTFTASKASGCEARLFAEPGCRMYVNTAVFMLEARAVGGLWRSMGVRCGIEPPDEAALGRPPLEDLIAGATRRPKGG
ncbi:hypothetical protein QBC47DRAFT_386074 [Echria macrotheca]|uniref:Uncharacterized protein n=1 Tax=Echria macrotheca TaxID=438768 RepID=A0AAJ0BBZ6_9PEZI|nr:hypothetical protein QBC47DRAFT_386074 [Echria macrotheca]